MHEKIYLIDDKPASASDIIRRAKGLDRDFGDDGLCFTSVGVAILRKHGHKVENNRRDECGKKN